MPAATARSAIALPTACGRGLVAAVLRPARASSLSTRAGRGQRRAGRVVDHLRVDVLVAAEDAQPRPCRRAADRACGRETSPLRCRDGLFVIHVICLAGSTRLADRD